MIPNVVAIENQKKNTRKFMATFCFISRHKFSSFLYGIFKFRSLYNTRLKTNANDVH